MIYSYRRALVSRGPCPDAQRNTAVERAFNTGPGHTRRLKKTTVLNLMHCLFIARYLRAASNTLELRDETLDKHTMHDTSLSYLVVLNESVGYAALRTSLRNESLECATLRTSLRKRLSVNESLEG